MTTKSTIQTSKKTFEIVAILCLIPALYIQARWLQSFYFGNSVSPAGRTTDYLEMFPLFLSSVRLVAIICLAFAAASIYFASFSFNQPKLVWRISSFVIVMIASLISLLCLFQMI